MSQSRHDMPADATMQAIMAALRSCYGNLDDPDFRTVTAALRRDPHRPLIDALRLRGIEVAETTDLNDDVSTQLVASQAGDHAALELSAVGPFAIVRHLGADGRSRWVVQPGEALTPLTAFIVTAVARAGFDLLDRSTVSRRIRMRRADGETEATLYQALFTDTDRIP